MYFTDSLKTYLIHQLFHEFQNQWMDESINLLIYLDVLRSDWWWWDYDNWQWHYKTNKMKTRARTRKQEELMPYDLMNSGTHAPGNSGTQRHRNSCFANSWAQELMNSETPGTHEHKRSCLGTSWTQKLMHLGTRELKSTETQTFRIHELRNSWTQKPREHMSTKTHALGIHEFRNSWTHNPREYKLDQERVSAWPREGRSCMPMWKDTYIYIYIIYQLIK